MTEFNFMCDAAPMELVKFDIKKKRQSFLLSTELLIQSFLDVAFVAFECKIFLF